LNVLVTYFTQTGNTELIARAISGELAAAGHEVHTREIDDIKPEKLDEYELVFVGSACHDADLAYPVIHFLDGITHSPMYKLVGFVTHSTFPPEGSDRRQELYEKWAGKCIQTFQQVSQEKDAEFLGYFHCMGVPTPEIATFIHQEIVVNDDEWDEYIKEVNKHPDEHDIEEARSFTREVLKKME